MTMSKDLVFWRIKHREGFKAARIETKTSKKVLVFSGICTARGGEEVSDFFSETALCFLV